MGCRSSKSVETAVVATNVNHSKPIVQDTNDKVNSKPTSPEPKPRIMAHEPELTELSGCRSSKSVETAILATSVDHSKPLLRDTSGNVDSNPTSPQAKPRVIAHEPELTELSGCRSPKSVEAAVVATNVDHNKPVGGDPKNNVDSKPTSHEDKPQIMAHEAELTEFPGCRSPKSLETAVVATNVDHKKPVGRNTNDNFDSKPTSLEDKPANHSS